jgi:A/G-specific adenine glycosylase
MLTEQLTISAHKVQAFRSVVNSYYNANSRSDLAWRNLHQDLVMRAYHILVSEYMLQQTQVSRVLPKYAEFLTQFPSIHALACADSDDVYRAWNGLGYNRRAKYIQQSARRLISATFPWDKDQLLECPGIGPNTAAAILTYTFDAREVFIETNIRSVFLHHFFEHKDQVSDTEILKLVEYTLPKQNYREWHWALMDYGSHIKKQYGSLLSKSKQYRAQSKFEGSLRQIRGVVVKLLIEGSQTKETLGKHINDPRLEDVLYVLEKEQIIEQITITNSRCYRIKQTD